MKSNKMKSIGSFLFLPPSSHMSRRSQDTLDIVDAPQKRTGSYSSRIRNRVHRRKKSEADADLDEVELSFTCLYDTILRSTKHCHKEMDQLLFIYHSECRKSEELQRQLTLYKAHFGPLTGEAKSTKVSFEEMDLEEEYTFPDDDIPIPRSPEDSPEKIIAPKLATDPSYAYIPLNSLTKSQKKQHGVLVSQNSQLPHVWAERKNSKSKSVISVNNRSEICVYFSIYDKLRVGVGKHFRISPVYSISDDSLLIEKPSSSSTRSRFLVFCRDANHFNESKKMNPSLFRSLPSYNIDFSDEVYIYLSSEGFLKGVSKLNWKTRKKRMNLGKKKSSFRNSLSRVHSTSSISRSIDMARVALVRRGKQLSPEENQFLEQRETITNGALEKLLGMPLEGKNRPRIALCGSGGGCRAMISTLGALIGAEESGLLDCFTYVSGVSGSTWTLGLWESLGLPPSELRENIIAKFEANLISRPSKKATSELVRTMRHNWKMKQKSLLGLIDIYGVQLATGLLGDTIPRTTQYRLSHQIPRVLHGDFPLPIYTAVQKEIESYHSWFEFTPFEVGCLDYESFVPSWAFGRTYDHREGNSLDFTPPPSLGLLLATFGSAFCAPVSRMTEEFFAKLEREVDVLERTEPLSPPPSRKETSNFKSTLWEHRTQWVNVIEKMSLERSKIAAPAKFPNFAYDPSKEATKQRKQFINIYDAGIDINLPFPPLLRPERKIDIIIACNASKSPNINRSRSLKAAAKWAESKGIKLPFMDFEHTFDDICSVYWDEDDVNCPMIIYLPLKTNQNYSDFDPQENQMNGGYCSTFNFSMTREQVEELSGLTSFNFLSSVETIKKYILLRMEQQNQKEENGEDEPKLEEQPPTPDPEVEEVEEAEISIILPSITLSK